MFAPINGGFGLSATYKNVSLRFGIFLCFWANGSSMKTDTIL
ncbi:Uncharacterised protein [Capnocytophaga ochracea]|uniref:Uncharacterized protein n=1 Tax=Capnocytophaga ochracea TaxID=1018 RepID=A0A2X2SMT8_CAPOC|nr:Uncharacterised protein [Capnocytophaga ochracea]